MTVPGGNHSDLSANSSGKNPFRNLPHVAVVGGMMASLGTAIITGLRGAKVPHVVSSFCFVGFALTHLFLHQRQLSSRIKKGYTEGRNVVTAEIEIRDRPLENQGG